MIVTARSRTGIRIVENEKSAPHGGRAGLPRSPLVFPSMRLSSKLPESWRQILSRSLELDVLAALFVFAAASFIFLKLVSEMREGETRSADQAILLALRDPNDLSNPIGPQWVETMCRDLTSLGSPTVLALFTIAAVSYLWIDGKRSAALFVALSVTGGAVLVTVLKFGFSRPRPELVSHLINVNSFSFPSGHATMAAVTYLTLGVLLARVQGRRRMKLYLLAVASILVLLVGFTRVYLGVHWPTDVLAGWCIGTAWALGCWLIATWLQSGGIIERGDSSAE
jgi:undecaprenyl-diphosphatase